ncbi:uncharacterized protein LOC119097039 [Pollicipes pollicipes]|uniref:uncharacterized protein LOC119097039 n=1 Tax=Pollicipes pollicipes TaxID=41117 RepID=UPI00188594A2|nr:uncharacterized protein LOC119097039 [Pollicipes pollicipes]
MKKTKKTFAFGLLLALTVTQGAGFGIMGGIMANPATMLSAARYMTQIVMRNMAQKRTSSASCVDHVSRSAVTFFNEASVSLQLGRLLQMTMRRSMGSGPAVVPLVRFCQLANVRRLHAASVTFVSRMTCLGLGAVDDTDRLFRSLVFTIEHVCRDGGHATTQFMTEASGCRVLDDAHEEQIGRVQRIRRDRRSVTARTPLVLSTTEGNSTRLPHAPTASEQAPQPPTERSLHTTTAPALHTTTAPTLHTASAPALHTTTAPALHTTAAPALHTTAAPALLHYPSLQACLDDVNALLPQGARLSPQEEMTDFLLTLPALLPRLLQRDGLAQFCPALLKGGDCAHLALSRCPSGTRDTMARFFRNVLRGILCDGIPDDEVLKQLVWSPEVEKLYFGL